MRLGDLLIAAGTITQEELEKGLALQKEQKGRLGEVLISNGIITEQQLIEALQMQLGIEFVDLTKVNIPTELAQVVPKNIAKQYTVVPIRAVKDELYLAMSDPLNFYAIEEVRKAVRRKVVPVLATKDAIEHSIQILYGNEGAARAIEEMRREAGAGTEAAPETDTAFTSNQLGDDSVSNAPTIRLVNSIIERAVVERASDIHLEPHETELLVRMRIDGIMQDILTVPRDLQNSVLSRLKIMAGLNIAERRVPQDGRFNVRVKDKNIDLRVSTLPTVYGEKIVCRLLDKSGGRIALEAIGLTEEGLAAIKNLLKYRNGVILVVGPTGSGKTTTMYSMIHEINTRDVNLVTLEDPVEYNIEGVNQVQINEKVGLTFASGLRSILRQDPDIIAVGEIRDGETADIAMRAAITGHVVLSTIHTNDAVGTIERLEDIGVEPYLVASAMRGMVSQRLLRKICPNCKQAYTATEEELRDLDIPDEVGLTLYRGKGCPNCFNTGYRGRTAVVEVMTLNSKLRRMISERAPRSAIEEELHKPESGFVSLRESAINLAREGVTTASEILRVVNDDD
ncbi:MAG: Flp pilus assembly complex ATPase component TadA [Oscillospiraceae bacterium]|nr:Flp pilus assembly complex ATPase component TadA [Oscillospiraceae bacterium]MBQ6610154.1 Flp pilus assembly complex ATPase component TadA [Oscillospiraceae bacterium]